MRNAARFLCAAALAATALAAGVARAQRPRPADAQPPPAQTQTNAPKPAPAPPSVKAKYEGGVVEVERAVALAVADDANRRLGLRAKTHRELLPILSKAGPLARP